MPSIKYSLEKNGPKRIEIAYTGYYKNLVITFDGKIIKNIAEEKELKAGVGLKLPDKSSFSIKLDKKDMELVVLRNGMPLPGSATDPETIFKTSCGFIFFLGGLNIIIGLAVFIFEIEFLSQAGMGGYSILAGVVMCVLGYFVTKKSRIALAAAVGLFILDGVLNTILAQAGPRTNFAVLGARIIFIMPVLRGFKAIKELKIN